MKPNPQPDPSRALSLRDSMSQALSCVGSVSEAKDLAGRAKALQSYAKTSGQNLEVQNEIAKLKIKAERKAGQILLDMEKKSNQHGEKNNSLQSLEELGISRMQASRWQALARVSDEQFEEYCAKQSEEGKEITQAGVIRLKQRLEDSPREKPHLACPSCGLRSNRCIETGDVIARTLARKRKCLHCGYVFKTWEFVIDPDNPPTVPIIFVEPNKRD